jgi:hypothetical protein
MKSWRRKNSWRCRKREGCWLKRRKLRVQCKGDNIPFPLISKGESTKKWEDFIKKDF